MKNFIIILVLAIAAVFVAGLLFAQEVDLSGTWTGETVVPDALDKDQVTLVLQKEEATYSGTVTDSMGMAAESPLENVEFKDGTLTAEFIIFNGTENVRIYFSLKMTGDRLVGHWSDGMNSEGPLDLGRKKE
jgi:hypothetical protein